jgi:cell wall-associated NlpC family hydrolase
VIALGTPASNLGPSAYPSSGAVLTFDSATVGGSTCKSTAVTLRSVSLFDGVVTASSVQATGGKGTVAGLAINGSAVTAASGDTVSVDGWGQLTLGATVGRVTGPLVLRLLQAHDSLPAGTAVVTGFAASAQVIAKPPTRQKQATSASRSRKHSTGPDQANGAQGQPQKPPPDYPAAPSPFAAGGGFTDTMQDNPVVSTALQYLGVRYRWGGASPKTGFDCSGLVMYVFAQLGIPLVHYAAAQYHAPDGVWVAPNRLQPGDLVFFTGSDGTRKAPGHVGIYIDDGYIIDAPHTGAFVRIDSLNEPKLADQYVGARRIMGASLDARHLLAIGPGLSTTALPFGFRPQTTFAPLGSFGVAAAGTTAVSTASGHWMWVGVILGGVILLLAAGLVIRRRRASVTLSPSLPSDGPTDE